MQLKLLHPVNQHTLTLKLHVAQLVYSTVRNIRSNRILWLVAVIADLILAAE